MNDSRLAELREKYKDRNLLEELGWGAYHNHGGYTSKAAGEFLNWLCNAAYRAIKAQSQWIPITEKLPDLDKCVLATTSWGTITIAERWKDTKGEENWFVSEGECNAERDDIVAWKPLPEPYKGVTEHE